MPRCCSTRRGGCRQACFGGLGDHGAIPLAGCLGRGLDALDRLTAGRTVLLIAHRRAVIRRADRILTIENGRVLQEACA
jgi:hypothetical protein